MIAACYSECPGKLCFDPLDGMESIIRKQKLDWKIIPQLKKCSINLLDDVDNMLAYEISP